MVRGYYNYKHLTMTESRLVAVLPATWVWPCRTARLAATCCAHFA